MAKWSEGAESWVAATVTVDRQQHHGIRFLWTPIALVEGIFDSFPASITI